MPEAAGPTSSLTPTRPSILHGATYPSGNAIRSCTTAHAPQAMAHAPSNDVHTSRQRCPPPLTMAHAVASNAPWHKPPTVGCRKHQAATTYHYNSVSKCGPPWVAHIRQELLRRFANQPVQHLPFLFFSVFGVGARDENIEKQNLHRPFYVRTARTCISCSVCTA